MSGLATAVVLRGRRSWIAGAAALVGTSIALPFNARALPSQPDWWAQWRRGELRGFTCANLPALDGVTLRALRETGARLARVGIPFRRDASGYRLEAGDALALAARLQDAADLGLGLVALGLFDDGVAEQPIWRDAALRDGFVRAWSAFAARFGSHPALAGIDLLNEPHPSQLSPAEAQQSWVSLAAAAVSAIRRAGSRAPVICESVLGAHPSALRGMVPLPDARVVYSVHFYTPHDITHQRVHSQWGRHIPYPAGPEWQLGAWDPALGVGVIDRTRLARELRFVRDFEARFAVPMYVGEFGCVRWAPDGSALRWIGDCVDLFDAARWSWTFHSFRTWTGWDAEIGSADPRDPVRRDDAPVMRRLRAALTAVEPAGHHGLGALR